MKKTLFILLVAFLFISSISFAALPSDTIPSETASTPEISQPETILPHCVTCTLPVSNCTCGGVTIEADSGRYCGPDNAIYLTESDCEQEITTNPSESEQGGAGTESVTQMYSSLEIIYSWRVIASLVIVISIILIAMAYAIGIGLEIPEMQAWAASELRQVFANVIIILGLFVVVGIIDLVILVMVNNSGIPDVYCEVGKNCLNQTANAYLNDYIVSAKAGARNVLDNNLDASAWANRRIGFYCLVIYCAQFGFTTTLVGEYMLDSDRYTIIFEFYQGILSSLYSQKFFINEICFKFGPVILALGIVARSFFVTRKTGGLLIAVAAGIMFFFPAMYVFDWMTLDMTLNADKAFQDQQGVCPEECMNVVPLAYYYNSTAHSYVMLNTTTQIYNLFNESQSDNAKDMVAGRVDSATTEDGTIIYTCNVNTSGIEGAQPTCDRSCRELPYSTAGMCANISMQIACAAIPEQCKVIRVKEKEIDETERAKCQQECRMVPPLESNCNFGNCLQSRFDCRVAKINDLSWRPSIDSSLKGAEKCNDYPKDCNASLNAYDSCVWVMPEFGSCKELCSGCPEECRFDNPSVLNASTEPQCFNSGNLLSECEKCPATCKANTTLIQSIAPTDEAICSSCPITHRIMPADEVLPDGYTNDNPGYNCSLLSCPAEYRANITRAACEECASVAEEYTYDPPINFNCGDLCKPADSAPAKSAGEYSKIGEDGLVGKEEIKTVSKLMIPGYLLPLFNIAATIIVIMALSAFLGGDVEIPGLGKIF